MVSGGATESARLLLLSRSRLHPSGLGNRHDWVGRNLQGHTYTGAVGFFERETYDDVGPGVCISVCDYNHGTPGLRGGGMLANEFIRLPFQFTNDQPPGTPSWGKAHKDFMRRYYRSLARGLSLGDALKETKAELIRGGAAPGIWASFTLVGDPTTRLQLQERPEGFPRWLLVMSALAAALLAYGAIRKRRAVTNHLGTVHAIAMCNMAELAAGIMSEATVPSSHRWIPKGMTVEYLKKAGSDLRAVAELPVIPDFGSAAELPVPVSVTDSSGEEVCRAVIRMWVAPRK